MSELHGYSHFFAGIGIPCEVVTPKELPLLKRKIDWYFMGVDRSHPIPGIFRIHDYLSPSTPPARRLKDWGKRWINARPDLRIFKNHYTRQCFGFSDAIPELLMNMGIADEWLQTTGQRPEKSFDFIYIGELSAARQTNILLDRFTQGDLRERTLLLLSRNYEQWQRQYASHPNILFKGPVDKAGVKDHILRSRFAINYIPDREPFNQLPATKMLEYAACGVPILSTSYPWVRQFQQQYGGNYLYLSPDLHDLTWQRVTDFNYHTPAMSDWTWGHQIKRSGILEYLRPLYTNIRWPIYTKED
ncbi:hypothetical protein [Paraflavitalea pollutisoli]|uniref:hypothetical protein n=1 Tax=Paraflavitalea pollutisoli TaxID=3034143 RepID=UPI0023ECECC1|nr:hypothetical protein [Paraflavitalea sp. H1-2-19X]